MNASLEAVSFDPVRLLAGLARRAPGAGPAWHADLRERSAARFEEIGLPGPKVEHWRETSLAPLVEPVWATFVPATRGEGGAWDDLGLPTPGAAAAPLVGDGWWAGPLSAAPEAVAAAAREHLGRIAPAEREPFAALGVAAAAEPLVVHVAAGVRAPDMHVPRHVGGADGRPRLGASHLLVLVGENAQVRLIETHTAEDGAPLLAVPLTEIHAEAGARVEHALVQAMPETAFAVATLGVHQLAASRVRQHALAIGGALARLEIHARLDGEGADADLRGLMLARGRQHLDCRSVIDHAVPGATSHETYKAILRDRARTVFAGRIVVREGAQQTDARQQNDNLVLSRHALARTRPQLEIYADDVKCAHGATVGRLDDEALFYLRARGIPLPEARRILIRAFAAAVVDDIPCAPLVERIEAEIDARIPGPEEEEVS